MSSGTGTRTLSIIIYTVPNTFEEGQAPFEPAQTVSRTEVLRPLTHVYTIRRVLPNQATHKKPDGS